MNSYLFSLILTQHLKLPLADPIGLRRAQTRFVEKTVCHTERGVHRLGSMKSEKYLVSLVWEVLQVPDRVKRRFQIAFAGFFGLAVEGSGGPMVGRHEFFRHRRLHRVPNAPLKIDVLPAKRQDLLGERRHLVDFSREAGLRKELVVVERGRSHFVELPVEVGVHRLDV